MGGRAGRVRTAVATALVSAGVAAGLATHAYPQGAPEASAMTEAGAIAPPVVSWRVENPFRFLSDPHDTAVHRASWLALTEAERAHPVLSAERALAARHPDGWAATMVANTCWKAGRNRHQCPGGKDYINPKSHAVVVDIKGVADAAVECTWLTAPLGGAKMRGEAITRSCSEPVRIEVPYPRGLRLTVEIGGIQVASETVKVRDLLIAAMGDSFASGEGNPDVPVRFSPERSVDYGTATDDYDLTGYPARVGAWKQIGDKRFVDSNPRWLDQACHRSLYSHQLRAALQLAVEDPHRAVTFVGVACSGAEVTWGMFLRYKGNEWVPNPPALSQISAIAEEQCGENPPQAIDMPEAYHMQGVIPELQGGLVLRKCDRDVARRIDLLLVSIGGNDIGFARLVANAVLANQSTLRKLGGWFGQVHGQAESSALLKDLDERYKALNRAVHGMLHVPWNESDRVILTAYPPLAVLGDGSTVCPDGNGGMEVMSDFSLNSRQARVGEKLANELHQVMEESARTHGWSFAAAHRPEFNGRGICAGFTDIAFSVADDLRLPRKRGDHWEPYNPGDFRAYVTRQRWFRTPNDAFMTGHFHVSGSVLQKALKLQSLSWFQVLLASTYSGAFHPTAEGQAAIADAVVTTARDVLARHGQGETLAIGGP